LSKKKGDYLFGLKGNQGKTPEAVKERFDTHTALAEFHIKTTVDGDHGRIEVRVFKVFPAEEILDLNRTAQHDVTELTFLGYTFRRRKSKTKMTNELFDGFQPSINKEAIKSIKRVIKGEWRLKSRALWSSKISPNKSIL
jgi:hypothetical protein